MPIYEYECKNCGKKMSFLILSQERLKTLECKNCKSKELNRLLSRVATPKSEESRLESLADPSKLAGIDEKDPKSISRWMKQMGKEMGEDAGEDFNDTVDHAMEEAANEDGGQSDDL
ncbi:MAG: FmdB family transcriptional regulator [Candidatus Schekmanbacteria bacterium RBG_16_38_10]|uniref:FmdB family transcriptional regulator n=1 Tax=Candidatus Schekmanbacteria bacterium RBG_16_38_10 TaxID=1817879 RepID=A0A1F7RU11_9BACT|nr:MAG: FmdB family transcriptional regulator [Candidatus Schekmanbacteria bacterium RBG_16_38_10]